MLISGVIKVLGVDLCDAQECKVAPAVYASGCMPKSPLFTAGHLAVNCNQHSHSRYDH